MLKILIFSDEQRIAQIWNNNKFKKIGRVENKTSCQEFHF